MKFFMLWLLSATSLFADLIWDANSLSLESMAGDRFLETKFKFENAGQKPVAILAIQSSCGCTTVTTAKKVYAPGEKGELAVKFTFGGRRGQQHKAIVIQTDDPSAPAVTLMLNVNIIEVVKVRPAYLYWKKDSEKTSQTLKLKMNETITAKVVSVSSSSPKFTTELKPANGGKEYELIVTPLDTATPAMATLTIQTDYPAAKPEIYKAYAQVK
jgi:uncharacterized protein DUF1573